MAKSHGADVCSLNT